MNVEYANTVVGSNNKYNRKDRLSFHNTSKSIDIFMCPSLEL